MKDGTPMWSAVVIVPRGQHQVLALNRGFSQRDPAFPGGDWDVADASPAATARRELWEETGIEAIELKCVDRWQGERGQEVYAFLVSRWKGSRIRPSAEGKPFWTRPDKLLAPTATFREDARRLLQKVGELRSAA
ncbi:MAG: NUDIX domain-containing protein [Dehalococcoidia bacterium]